MGALCMTQSACAGVNLPLIPCTNVNASCTNSKTAAQVAWPQFEATNHLHLTQSAPACFCGRHIAHKSIKLVLMQADIPTLVGSCLVLATRFGLDQPQPVLDHTELADIVNVPAGQCCLAM